MQDGHDAYKDKLIVGIDLGTTNSGVAVWRDESGQVEMLLDADGKSLTPSVVGWDRGNDRWLVGRAAERLAETNPASVAYSIKRYIGRWFTDPAVVYGHRDLSYKLESGGGKNQLRDVVVNFGPNLEGETVRLTAPQVSGKVLAKLRQDAANALALPLEEVQYAVVTVPAYFDVMQRRATILAGEETDHLTVVDILNEPTAAALAYRDVILRDKDEQRILVYDLGGGTFDISLLEVSVDEMGYTFYALVADGDTRLGGDDIDISLLRWLANQIEERYGHKVRSDDLVTLERLRNRAEAAKIALSDQESYTIRLPNLDLGSRAPFDAEVEVTRAQLEACAHDVIERTQRITRRAVEEVANLRWDDIDAVLLVGGQTLMPAVQRSVEELAGRKPHLIQRPQEAVALGAGEYAHIRSLGREKFEENALINVIALPLGLYVPGDEQTFRPLVPANRQVPYTSEPYPITTTEDNQRQIDVTVLQGRRREVTSVEECIPLGTLTMEVMPAPARTPRFNAVLDVQSNGTMQLQVTDTRTNQTKSIDIFETNVAVWRDKLEEEQAANG